MPKDEDTKIQNPVNADTSDSTKPVDEVQKENVDTAANEEKAENSTVETRVSELETRLTDTENKLKSALADYQNMLKEVDSQRAFTTDMIKKTVFSDLIDLFTDLYMGIEMLPKELKDDAHIQGLYGIISKYRDLLKRHGVTEIVYAEGDSYDPSKAEVVGFIQNTEKDGKVAQTVQPGYSINNVLVKPARVMLFKRN